MVGDVGEVGEEGGGLGIVSLLLTWDARGETMEYVGSNNDGEGGQTVKGLDSGTRTLLA